MEGELNQILEIAQSSVSIAAIIVAGAWTYYRFIKGRLFSPKVELGMTHLIAATGDPNTHIVFCEICLKNVGSVQLNLDSSSANCHSVDIADPLKRIFETEDIISYMGVAPHGDYYVDPGENTYREFRFTAPADPPALLVTVRIMYNKVHMVERRFAIVNDPVTRKIVGGKRGSNAQNKR